VSTGTDRALEPADVWWAAVADGRILLRHCLSCGTHWLPWTPYCPECGPGPGSEWVESGGRGTLYSWVVVRHSVGSPDEVPFTVAAVLLEEGAQLYGRLAYPDRPLVGDEPVHARFEQRDGRTVVAFSTADLEPGQE
jgi:uncharacterized OB-fold protein